MHSPLLTVAEAACYLRCSASTVYSLLHKNKIAKLKQGKIYFILESSLDDYIQSRLLPPDA